MNRARPMSRRHVRDEEGRADAQRGEEQEERHPPPAAVGERAEDRRDERVEPDADDDRDRQQRALPSRSPNCSVVDEPQPDRPGHDREAEDRVREVVEGPGDRDAGLAAGRQAAEPAGACRHAARRGTAGRGGVSHRAMIEALDGAERPAAPPAPGTIRAMTDTRLWDRAAALPAPADGRRRPRGRGAPRGRSRPSPSCSTSCATPSCASRPSGCASRSGPRRRAART